MFLCFILLGIANVVPFQKVNVAGYNVSFYIIISPCSPQAKMKSHQWLVISLLQILHHCTILTYPFFFSVHLDYFLNIYITHI